MSRGKKRNYFIAIIPPDDLQEEITSIKNQVADMTGAVRALKILPHITLVPPFYLNEEEYLQLEKSMSEKKFIENSIRIELKNYSHFRHDVIFIDVMHSVKLEKLSKDLINETNKINPVHDTARSYHPHITLAFRDLQKDAFEIAWNQLMNKNYSAQFIANSFWILRHDDGIWKLLKEFL
jgi:2'-5' RNA ligase